MIRLERTLDLELVRQIMTHAALYPFLADDFYPASEDFRPNATASIWYLLVFDGDELLGLFMSHPINALAWEVHVALYPVAWGRRARAAGKAFLSWLWQMTPARVVVGFVPTSNPLAVGYAKGLGLRELGRVPLCYQRQFQLFDIVILCRERPAIS